MQYSVDTEKNTIRIDGREAPLYSTEGFEALSDLWSKVAWNEKYTYTFTWMGIPTIQLPEDMVRLQEVLWRVQPDVIIECGVAHGGGSIFLASLCKAMGKGRVIGVELEFRGNHREQVEQHVLSPLITLIEGSSVDPAIVQSVADRITPGETVLVILDSNHSKSHVLAELAAYAPMVTRGSYIVATDGCMEVLTDVPRGKPEWATDNPAAAAREFLSKHPEFVLDPPGFTFSESALTRTLTHWPDAWLKRVHE